ncbi:MAG TPA: LacI family DNA-binding transcriptional regulator [Candidatus Limnocylindrales bacterium]|nr:LacI family DNA-binding transcriptional regulator [Candidatus Limnocylindrales bacterium]
MEHQLARRVTIADVAEAAGVSKTAVSFAFNNPGRLAADTATRIIEVADSLGYRPDPVARMLTQRRTGTIGLVVPQALASIFSNPFFGMFSAGVAAVAEDAGYALHFISPLHGSLSRAIARATVDGVVAIGLAADHPEIAEIRRAGLPMTTVDSDPFDKLPSVDVDDEGGAHAAAEHIAELGHRDVLIIAIERAEHAPKGAEDTVSRRLRGYRSALAAVGVEVRDEQVLVSPATYAGGVAAIEQAWGTGRRPTAILAMSDAIAIGAIRGLRDRGLSIPADVSVVGFDDIELAETTDPPLTTVHQPIRGKGEEAARLLLSVLAGREEPAGHRRLATRLIVRASTASVPQQQGR